MAGIHAAAIAQGRAARGELQSIEVPQWVGADGNPHRVYFYPGLSVDEWVAIGAHVQADAGGRMSVTWDGCFECCRLLLRDETGRPLFAGDMQYRQLREKYDPVVLLDILNRSDLLKAFLDASVDEAKKP